MEVEEDENNLDLDEIQEVEIEEENSPTEDVEDDVSSKQKSSAYNNLTLPERIAVIKGFDKGMGVFKLMEVFNCTETQILFTLKHRKDYSKEWLYYYQNPQRIRRTISPHVLAVGIILFEYVWRLRHYPIAVSDENLKSAGKEFAELLRLTKFKTSKRWLERFKQSYRLDGSILLKSEIIRDNKPKKSLRLIDVFNDIAEELRGHHISMYNLTEDHICVLKAMRASKLNQSLSADPRRRKVCIPRILKGQSKASNPDTSEANIEFVEIMSDQEKYDSECSKSTKQDSIKNDYYTSNESCDSQQPILKKEIHSYKDALEQLQTLENFAFGREDLRAIGLINQLENYLKDKISENDEKV